GAGQALLVEKKRDRCADLSRQLTPLFGERVRVHCAEALKWLARCEERFDLVFIDPPYDLGLAAPACEALEALGLLKPDARIYVESRRHDAAPAVPESWERLREKDGGDVRAQLYRRP
ncbi:MAG TPA: 16S rRNA (guanine(966)-N(2))-methyltransferase RsmD, partial [Alcanivorax sp.]|nr:16S rRNA (guanine(966)-N(2))-methyltransferase RsmD [Alcanivorax sp.]